MNTWLAQYFLNPSFILPWGAALVAAPIIIHLINRLRYRRVRFAAMEFLLQSEQRNRRRLLLEQLLLLLLRILLVLAILALLARLILDPSQMPLFQGAKAHHVVLLDDSGSMRNRWGETTAFQQGVDVIRKLVAEGAHRPDTQQFSLLLLSDPDEPLFTQRDVNDAFLTELETKLGNQRCTHQQLDLAAGLDAAGKLLEEDRATVKHLHVASDFRHSNWVDQQALGGTIGRLDEAGTQVNLVKTVPEKHANLAVTRFTGDLQVAAAGVPVRLKVGVKNFSEMVAKDVRLSLHADGEKLSRSLAFNKIEAGEEVSREFDLVFNSAGKHRVRVGLPGDALAQDNSRFLVVEIADSNPVLIIDGDPAGHEGSFVADALAANPELTGIDPLIASTDYLRKHRLAEFRCIYLLNVSELSPDAVEPLRNYVASGGGLAWFLGEAVQPAFYNNTLYQEGESLFPVPLAPAPRELPKPIADSSAPDLQFADHPLFRVFSGQDNPFIESVRIGTYFPVGEDWVRDDNERKDQVRTIATLRTDEPFIFEHRFGRGRVVTCLSTAGPVWNNWARNPSYVILQLELQKHIARSEYGLQQRLVGAVIDVSLNPAEYTETVEITTPASVGEQVTRLQASPEQQQNTDSNSATSNSSESKSSESGTSPPAGASKDQESEVYLSAMYRQTDMPGVYRIKLFNQDQIPEERWIAYNVPTEESDLHLASNEEIRQRIGEETRVAIQEPGHFHWIQGEQAGQDVRRLLLIALVVGLLLEQLLAYRLSYHPKTAGAAA